MNTNDNNPPWRTMHIELLALDLDTCGRCTGTDRNFDEALTQVSSLLREAGTDVQITRHVVTTAAQAERLRMISSPTIRIDGRDMAIELRESNCGDCGDLCGCEGGVDCRVWVWQGREYTEAPKAMIIDGVLRAYAMEPHALPHETADYQMPENLRAYFAALETKRAGTSPGAVNNANECCDQSACCEPIEKEACCGAGSAARECGCR